MARDACNLKFQSSLRAVGQLGGRLPSLDPPPPDIACPAYPYGGAYMRWCLHAQNMASDGHGGGPAVNRVKMGGAARMDRSAQCARACVILPAFPLAGRSASSAQ